MKQQAPYTAEELCGKWAGSMREWKKRYFRTQIKEVSMPDYALTELGIAVLDMAGRVDERISAETLAALFD